MIINRTYKQIYWKRQDRKRSRWINTFVLIVKGTLNKQFRQLADSITVDNYSNEQIIMSKEPIEKMMVEIYKKVGVDFAKDSYNQLKSDGRVMVHKGEDELVDEWSKYMSDYAKMKAGNRIVSIAETNRQQALSIIREILDESASEGWGTAETASAIKRGLINKGIDINTIRAMRIAQTEVMTASNVGALEGAKSTGATEKYWIATNDDRTRETHSQVEEQNPVKMTDTFTVGQYQMESPGDPSGGAEEVINCRCTIAFG